MKKKHRIGIIGCGGISRMHAQWIMESPDLEVSALCDILPDRLSERQEQCSVTDDMLYNDYIEMLDSGKIDAVTICVPNYLHFEIAMEAVKRRIPYALEKPVCNNEKETKILMEETERYNIPNMICFSYRFESAARYARDLIRSGDLGKISHINVEYYQDWGLPAFDGSLTPLNWRFTKEYSITGALGDLGSHMIDMLRFLTGREFTRVVADIDTFIQKRPLPDSADGAYGDVTVDDYFNMIGQMEGPIAVNLSITRFAYSRGNYQRIEVYGEKGWLRYNLEMESGNSLEINIGNRPMRENRVWTEVPIPHRYKANQMQSYADILNNCGDGLAADIRDGHYCQKVVDSALESAIEGKRINL